MRAESFFYFVFPIGPPISRAETENICRIKGKKKKKSKS
jgi:hypothetical protein